MHTDVHRDIQYKNCSVQHSQVSAKHTFQARLPHNTTLLFKTGMIVHFHPRSHIQIQGTILMLGYWRNTHSFSKLLCAITIIFNVTLANLLRTKQQVLGTLVGISHPPPQVVQFKSLNSTAVGSSAQSHLITSCSQEAKEKGSQSQLHEDNAVPIGSSPTAHYVHNLHFCRDVHLENQTSSEVDILVLQSQVSSGMAEQRKQLLWTVDYETEWKQNQIY